DGAKQDRRPRANAADPQAGRPARAARRSLDAKRVGAQRLAPVRKQGGGPAVLPKRERTQSLGQAPKAAAPKPLVAAKRAPAQAAQALRSAGGRRARRRRAVAKRVRASAQAEPRTRSASWPGFPRSKVMNE